MLSGGGPALSTDCICVGGGWLCGAGVALALTATSLLVSLGRLERRSSKRGRLGGDSVRCLVMHLSLYVLICLTISAF